MSSQPNSTTQDKPAPAHLLNLDVLRLFLAGEVAFYIHYCAFNGHASGPWKIPAVPTFVCISGYLIPASLANSKGWPHFAWKRFLRVFPAFLVSLLLVLVLFGFKALPPVLLCYLTAGWIATNTTANGPLWSLMVEEVLYAFHALTRRLFGPIFVGLVLIAVCVVWRLYWKDNFGYNTVIAEISPVAAFFAGNLLYFFRAKIKQSWPVVAVSALLLLGMFNMPATPFGLPILGFPAYELSMIGKSVLTVLICLALPQLSLGRKPSGERRKWLDVSYGVYVFHAPFYFLFVNQGLRELPLLAAVASSTFALAIPCAFFIEQPALKLKNRLPSLPKQTKLPEPVEAVA